MPAPRRLLALLLTAAALGLAACGEGDTGDAGKAVDDLQQKADELTDKVADGKESAQDAAKQIQQDADDLGGKARDRAVDALEELKQKAPDGAKDDVQKAIDQLK